MPLFFIGAYSPSLCGNAPPLTGFNWNYFCGCLLVIFVHPARDVAELTPRCWKDKFEANPLLSDLARLGKPDR